MGKKLEGVLKNMYFISSLTFPFSFSFTLHYAEQCCYVIRTERAGMWVHKLENRSMKEVVQEEEGGGVVIDLWPFFGEKPVGFGGRNVITI